MKHTSSRESARQAARHFMGYFLAVAAVSCCTLVAIALGSVGREAPFLAFLPAVLITLWYAGFRPAVLSIVLSALAVDYYLIPPYYDFRLSRGGAVKEVIFVLSLGVASWLIDRSRVRSEKALALRDQLLETTPVGLLITDRDHRVVDCNLGATQLYGFSFADAVGKLPQEFLKTVYPESMSEIERKLDESGSWRGVLTRTTKDGREVISDSTWTLDRETGFILQADLNITGRIHAEKSAQESAAKLSAAIESMNDAFFIVDRDDQLTEVNEAFARFHRFPDKQSCSSRLTVFRSLFDFSLRDGTPVGHEELPTARALRGETGNLAHYVLQRKDTGEKWIGSYSYAPIRGPQGEIVAAVISARDVTESVRMQDELKRVNRALSALSCLNQALVESRDLEEEELYQRAVEIATIIGGYALAWVGVPEDDPSRSVRVAAVAGTCDDYARQVKVSWGDDPLGRGPTGTALKEGRAIVAQNFAVDGSCDPWHELRGRFGLRSALSLPLTFDGKPVAALSIYAQEEGAFGEEELKLLTELASDLSLGSANIRNRKAAEQERETRVNLEAQLRQSQKMEAIGTLAGGIAHDFNNLLMVIMAQLEFLKMDATQSQQRRLDSVMQCATRAAELTSRLLAFSRKQITQPSVTTMNTILSKTVDIVERLVREDVEIKTVLCDDPWPVKIDPAQFEEVIMNLVVNARDAMPDGGRLTLETANCALGGEYAKTHPLVPCGKYVMLAVADNGIGMTPETQARIFEPFFTTKPSGQGTGLGLAMAYGVVKQAGGFIWVYSEFGKGSSFKIYLPVAEHMQAEAQVNEQPESVAQGGATILLVEDDTDLRQAVAEFLESGGHTVFAADRSESACEIAEKRKHEIDLILSDVVLKGGNGKQLVQRLREIGCTCKVVYMSGYTPNAIVHHGVLEEGVFFLQKPFSKTVLLSKVASALQGERAN
jgi:PAS domain S-box-containing protein